MYFNCITFFVVACATVTLKCFPFRWLLILFSIPLAPRTYDAPVSRSNSNAKGVFDSWYLVAVSETILSKQKVSMPNLATTLRKVIAGAIHAEGAAEVLVQESVPGTQLVLCIVLVQVCINIETWIRNWAQLTCYFFSFASDMWNYMRRKTPTQ